MKLVSLVSSGIDSPVATYLLSSYADEVILLHADTTPFIEEKEKKVFLSLSKQLRKTLGYPIDVHIVPHGEALKVFKENCDKHYTCVFCKRMLLRYAEAIASLNGCSAIVMGDSLGQVASQTLYNLRVIDEATNLPVLRPLIGLDKEEIIRVAKDIGTYNYSTIPIGDCKAVPDKPVTKASIDAILREEEKIDIDSLVKKALKEAELINL